jgi:hypothetical protein
MGQTDSHPNSETLKAYGAGEIGGATAETIVQHLQTCIDCRRAVSDATVVPHGGQSPQGARPVPKSRPGSPESDVVKPPGTSEQFRLAPTLPPPSQATAVSPATPPPVVGEPIPAALAASPDYEVIREISRGGMGVVYLARNRRMNRLEALKVGRKIRSLPAA